MARFTKSYVVLDVNEEIVYLRAGQKNGVDRYHTDMQDVLLIEGKAALKALAMKYSLGFIQTRSPRLPA